MQPHRSCDHEAARIQTPRHVYTGVSNIQTLSVDAATLYQTDRKPSTGRHNISPAQHDAKYRCNVLINDTLYDMHQHYN